MLTADKLMVALIGHRSRTAQTKTAHDTTTQDTTAPDDSDATVARARSRERILLVHRTLARRRQRVIAPRRLP